MSPEHENDPGEEDEEEEEGDEDDEDSCNSPRENTAAANGVMSTDTFLDLLYLATRSNSQNTRDGNSDSMNWEDCDGSYGSVNCSDGMDSDCDCNDSDAYSDGEYDDDDGDVEIILEEIRRISEALLGSTMSELVDAERRISLKSFDELAARDESVSSIMDEWDYEDSEVSENDDCQGVVERIQLFMRPLQRDGNVIRDVTERSLSSRSAHRAGRQTTNPVGSGNIYVVFFDPNKVGVFPKFAGKEPAKGPRLKRILPMKKAPQRVRFDKDSVRRWSEDDEKEEIARLVRGGGAARRGPAPPGASVGPEAGAGAGRASSRPFVVTLPVGAATPADVRVALHANRVLVAEVMRRGGGGGGAGAGDVPGDGAPDGATGNAPGNAPGNPPSNAPANSPEGDATEERVETVLVRRWAVPEGVDVDAFRCFLGEGLLLVASLPLPDGFVWPFFSPPALLGGPLRVASPCDFAS